MTATTSRTRKDAAPFASPELKAKADAKRHASEVEVIGPDGTSTPSEENNVLANPNTRRKGQKRTPQEKVREGKARVAKRTASAPKQTPAKGQSKADRVRALLDKGKTVKEIAQALADEGVTWSYAWDVAAAYEKKTGKVFIASHAAKATKKAAAK